VGFFTSNKSWGAQMKGAKGTMSAKEARAKAAREANPSLFKQRKAAAKGGKGKK
jgi:hypothetical protein